TRPGTCCQDSRCRRNCGERWYEHVIAGADAGRLERQLERRGTRRNADGEARPDTLGELVFEGVELGSEQELPTGGDATSGGCKSTRVASPTPAQVDDR